MLFSSRRPSVKTLADSKPVKRPVKFSNSNVDKTLLLNDSGIFKDMITCLFDFYVSSRFKISVP